MMKQQSLRSVVSVFVLALLASASSASAQERTAEAIIRDYESVPWSTSMKLSDKERRAASKKSAEQQIAFAQELRRRFPDHPRVAELMTGSWTLAVNVLGERKRVYAEARKVLAEKPGPKIAMAARRARALAAMTGKLEPLPKLEEYVLDVVKNTSNASTEDKQWASGLLVTLAMKYTADPVVQKRLCELAIPIAPASGTERGDAKGQLRLITNVGAEVDFVFDDVVSGKKTDAKDLRGKYIIIHVFSMHTSGLARDVKMLKRAREVLQKKVAILGCEDSSDAKSVAKAAKKAEVDWPVYVGSQKMWTSKLGVIVRPTYLLVNKEGALAAACWRVAPLVEFIRAQERTKSL